MTIDAIIRRLVNESSIGDQQALRKLLAGEGYVVAQPTLSRHLKRLSIAKRDGRYQEVDRSNRESYRYTLLAAPPNLLVVKTEPGHGQLLAVMIDQHSIEGMAGTVAGDDTIFIAVEKPERLSAVEEQLAQLLGKRGRYPLSSPSESFRANNKGGKKTIKGTDPFSPACFTGSEAPSK